MSLVAVLAEGRGALGPLPLPEVKLSIAAWSAIAAVPVAAAIFALLAALATVHRQLKRMP